MPVERPARVLIVDDSPVMRSSLTSILGESPDLEVVGTAVNGREALAKVRELKPDVVTMDVEMPEMDGVQALEHLMTRHPVPVVMLSSLTKRGADVTLHCLELGAVDFVAKPGSGRTADLASVRYVIRQKVRQAASATVTTLVRRPKPVTPIARVAAPAPTAPARKVVAIGASTGGPRALFDILTALPASLGAGVVVVQHMPPTFTQTMAERFNTQCALTVREAQAGEAIYEDVVLIAPGGQHLRLGADHCVRLTEDPPKWGVRPAVDLMFEDVAAAYGATVLGVLLTGMGRDGAAGMGLIKAAGGSTIAQDEASCVVYGMPRAAVEMGVADRVAPLSTIAGMIQQWCATTRTGEKTRC